MGRERGPAKVRREPLPDHRDLALFVATLFQRLGGCLDIDEAGKRHVHRPDAQDLRGLPQLADADPHERFRSVEEWQGAMKVAEYWLSRLGARDREYVFTLLAPLSLDREDGFDFRARLRPSGGNA